MADATLKIVIDALDNASDDLKRLQKELEGVDKTNEKTKKSTSRLTGGMDQFKASILPAVGIVTSFGLALRKTYDMAKEGAGMEYSALKFERMATAAGTVADVLLDDLRKAVRGTKSDMELMTAAGDFMALGLAKSHDEIVRLTRVAGALNMDMNQLVLTLTNQTTMRLDALGVSVDGFDAKVKELEKSGLDANKAFVEAFLQQAEAQIEKVGDVADTTAGKIAQFESKTKNLSDKMTMALVPALDRVITSLDVMFFGYEKINDLLEEHDTNMQTAAASYDEYIAEMLRAADVGGRLGKFHVKNYQDLLDNEGAMQKVALQLGFMTEGEWNARDAGLDMNEQLRQTTIDAGDAAGGIFDVGDEAEKAAKKLDSLIMDALKPLTAEMLNNKIMATLTGDALLDYALATGQLDQKSYGLLRGLQTLTERFDLNKDGVIDATEATDEYWLALDRLNGKTADTYINEHKTTIYQDVYLSPIYSKGTDYSGTGKGKEAYATGGQVDAGKPMRWQEYGYPGEIMVPSMDGYVLSRSDAERILAQAAQGGRGGGDTYTLIVNEAGRRGDTPRDFQLLKSLAR